MGMARKPYVFKEGNPNGVPSFYNKVPETKSSGGIKAKDKKPVNKKNDKKNGSKVKLVKKDVQVKSKGFKE